MWPMTVLENEPACLAGWDRSSIVACCNNSSKYRYIGRVRPLPTPCMSQHHPPAREQSLALANSRGDSMGWMSTTAYDRHLRSYVLRRREGQKKAGVASGGGMAVMSR